MNITQLHDYIACDAYDSLQNVKRACGYTGPLPSGFWTKLATELCSTETTVVSVRRINPYSPNMHLLAFVSEHLFSPSNQVNVIRETDPIAAKALCAVLNSVVFLAQFFLLKEESTGRFVDVRFYDMAEMLLKPDSAKQEALRLVFEEYGTKKFPSLREQFDRNFDDRYKEFWESQGDPAQQRLWSILDKPVEPSPLRVAFDKAVCKALDIPTTSSELTQIYTAIVDEMMITRRLRSD